MAKNTESNNLSMKLTYFNVAKRLKAVYILLFLHRKCSNVTNINQ